MRARPKLEGVLIPWYEAEEWMIEAERKFNNLRAVLCDPDGNPSIQGSKSDLEIIKQALKKFEQDEPEPGTT